jgi:hypothetical protein
LIGTILMSEGFAERGQNEKKRSLIELLESNIDFITFQINTTMVQYVSDLELLEEQVEYRNISAKVNEYPLVSIFHSDSDTRNFVLHMIRHESLCHIGRSHGLSMNGRSRGDSTRLVIDSEKWEKFTVRDLQTAFNSFENQRKYQGGEKSEMLIFEVPVIDRCNDFNLSMIINNKKYNARVLEVIKNLYQSVDHRDICILGMKSEIKELENLLRLHEESIFTCNMKLAIADKRIAVEKGLKTRSSEKYSGIIEAMNLESSSKEKLMNNREIKMSRDRGVIKMISTKHAITMNREKSSLAKTKEFYDSHKVSLPLLLFEVCGTSVTKFGQ